ncbi:hypothetical protein SDRG_10026 [Saprolegnia diclina VS20]|uniref:ABC transmembrane type-1 domain-containing protein n=1 Tax=Saprolegnia diclina (strain VS20) TaxID=1156394 RepID=T0RIT1_SAPDV|nr:hypothetical protein SDRG_10026 [Saprolegnia diclina VS20]EQC32278.1 hypothetical protein SDRG_10026 [Saprolegnia diclina VS20]|eukprot:XP_008614219.1 hypothetical protein SDRG_10026 [Saprolegnia diclina VS20]
MRPSYHEVKSPVVLSADAPTLHPSETASWPAHVTLSWLSQLLRRGAKTPLQEDDVWSVRRADSAAALAARFQQQWRAERQTLQPSFGRALLRTLRWESISAVSLYFASTFLSLLQPILIKSILQVLTGESSVVGIASGYVLAVLLTLVTLLSVTAIDYGQSWMTSIGANARSIGMDAIFTHSLAQSSARVASSGDVVTLASVDAERLYLGYLFVAWTLTVPTALVCIFVLLGIELGAWPALAGGVAMFGMLYLGYASATSVGHVRARLLSTQAQRLKLTNEALAGARALKLNNWERHLEDEITRTRTLELTYLQTYQNRRILNMVVLSVAPILSLALCLGIYVAQGDTLDAAKAFVALAYINNARHPCTVFANAVVSVAEAKVSAKRIGDFLLQDELPSLVPLTTHTPPSTTSSNEGALVVAEERQVGAVTAATYVAYCSASGFNGVVVGTLLVSLFVIAQVALSMTDWFMGYWSAHATSGSHGTYTAIYVGMALASIGLVWLRSVFLLQLAVVCSRALHGRLLHRVLEAPVNTFFDVTPIGRILNRFSSDLDQVDSQLPMFGLFFAQVSLQVLAIVVVCAVSLPYLLLLYIPIAYVFYVVQRMYVRASSDLKRMDATSRSPLLHLLNEALSGLPTLRAYRQIPAMIATHRARIDANTKFFLTYRISSQWLTMRLDWLAALVLAA